MNSITFNNGELYICHLERTPKKKEKKESGASFNL